VDREKIIDALSVIKAECARHLVACPFCPFYRYSEGDGDCWVSPLGIRPSEWQINTKVPKPWRAIEED